MPVEVFVQFDESVVAPSGRRYSARVCGHATSLGQWEGWLEFEPLDAGEALRTGRETTQPNRTDLGYWATGLTRVYLQGALARAGAVLPTGNAPPPPRARGVSDTHAAAFASAAVLDPFAVYVQGEEVLTHELRALSADHLRSVIRDYELGAAADASGDSGAIRTALITQIVVAVRGLLDAR